jgi:predicted nucleic acid-binding protein
VILDTNIILRLIDGPSGPRYKQIRRALRAAIAAKKPLRVDAATIHEVVYVLASQATGYGYTRTQVTAAVHQIVEAPELNVEHAGALYRAATDYGANTGIDFHDCYIAARARDLNEDVYSLDGDFKKLK